jgi:uncharacterized protein involved in cysteine biosynthesis
MKPELKALLFVVAFIIVTVLLSIVMPMIHPQALVWIAIALMIYAVYTLAVSYFKFSDGVDNLNTKYEDKK